MNLLETVRRDRGALTEAKLEQLLLDARVVVERTRQIENKEEEEEQETSVSFLSCREKEGDLCVHSPTKLSRSRSPSPPAKRVKTETIGEIDSLECSQQQQLQEDFEGSPTHKYLVASQFPDSVVKEEEEMLNLGPSLGFSDKCGA